MDDRNESIEKISPDFVLRYLSVDEGNVDPVVIQQVSGYRTNPVDFIDHG